MPSFSKYTFDYAFRILLILLPFMTVLSVFTKEVLHIPGFSFLKELLMVSLIATLAYGHITGKNRIQWSKIDFVLIAYILLLIIVSFTTTKLPGILYGGRYDFSFFIIFFALYHGYQFLEKPVSYYLRLFLGAGGVMIIVSMLLKWPFSEDLLLYLGYSGNPSNWQFGSSIPIFHGVEGANVRRFQGLLDGPNTMGAFLLVYLGVFLYYFRKKKDWYFFNGIIALVLIILIFYTYSRSAALGLFGGVGFIILFSLREILQKYRTHLIVLTMLFSLSICAVFIQYSGNMKAILQRGGSTNGHIERMISGMQRFLDHPMGQGLGSAGPAYRYINNMNQLDRREIEEIDRFYIPESWYIQQLIEGGILGFLSFLILMVLIFLALVHVHIFIAGMFLAIGIMNLFLHTFESSIVSLTLFSLIGLLITYSEHGHDKKI